MVPLRPPTPPYPPPAAHHNTDAGGAPDKVSAVGMHTLWMILGTDGWGPTFVVLVVVPVSTLLLQQAQLCGTLAFIREWLAFLGIQQHAFGRDAYPYQAGSLILEAIGARGRVDPGQLV